MSFFAPAWVPGLLDGFGLDLSDLLRGDTGHQLQNLPLAGCQSQVKGYLRQLDREGNDPRELCPPACCVNANNSGAGDACQDEGIGIQIGEPRKPIDIVDRVETTTAVLGLFENPEWAASAFRQARQALETRFPRPRDRASPYLHLPCAARPRCWSCAAVLPRRQAVETNFAANRGSLVAGGREDQRV